MANLYCSCGRLLHDTRAFYCPTCLFHHYSRQQSHNQRYTGDRFTLPDRPKSTSNTPPSPPSHPTWQHSNSRRSMDSPASSGRPSSSSDTNPLSTLSRPRHVASQYSSSSSASSVSSSSSYSRRSSTSPSTAASPTRNDSIQEAYSPIAAGFVRLSRSKDNSLGSSDNLTALARGGSPARRIVELEAARMFTGPA